MIVNCSLQLTNNMQHMTVNTKNDIIASKLISLIPGDELNRIAQETNVNHCIKVLDGKSVFYLLFYAMVECQRNSLRTMQDIFNSTSFKFLFNLPAGKTIRYNSISERLSVINPEFFKQAYELIFSVFSEYYSEQEIEQRLLIRVDSTIVAEATNKQKEGIEGGPKSTKNHAASRKKIKYTFGFDRVLPCTAEVFTNKTYASESVAVPEVIYSYTEKNYGAVFVFDRGMESCQVMDQLTGSETPFVTRIKPNSRYKVERVIEKGGGKKNGILEMDSDMVSSPEIR